MCFMHSTYVRRIAAALIFYGLTIGATDIAGNKYLNFTLVELVEIPACLLYWLIMENMSRKMSLSSMFLLTGTTCAAFNLMSNGECAPCRDRVVE